MFAATVTKKPFFIPIMPRNRYPGQIRYSRNFGTFLAIPQGGIQEYAYFIQSTFDHVDAERARFNGSLLKR